MKKIIILVFIFATVFGVSAQNTASSGSGGGKFGLGLSLFGPFGITGKYQMDEKLSIESSLGLGFIGNGRFHLHGVLLYNFYQINDSVNLYAGGGLVLQERYRDRDGEGNGYGHGRGRGNWNNFYGDRNGYDNSLGIRAPIGISWKNADKKFELSAELYLNLFVTGREGANLGLALAGRYYF